MVKRKKGEATPSSAVVDRILRALDSADVCDEHEIEISVRVGKHLLTDSTQKILAKSIQVVQKEDTEERYVLGIVLEPLKEMKTADVQDDTYSAAEVRKACHLFMQDFGNMGLQHQIYVNGQVKVLENWIATDDTAINGQKIVKGTWMMAVRVVDDNLWQAVKDGKLTGFSIGGKAERTPLAV